MHLIVACGTFLDTDLEIQHRTELFEIPYEGENPNDTKKAVTRSRDLLMQDEKQTYLRLGSDLREVLEFIKYSNDWAALVERVKSNDRYKSMNWRAATVLNRVTKSDIKFQEREDKIDMWKALDDLREEGVQFGMEKGIQAGLERAIQTMLLNGISTEKILDMFPAEQVLVQKLAKQVR